MIESTSPPPPRRDSGKGPHRPLTARETAARLGVKRATLYAYVSRGLLRRWTAGDGRRSLFDADEVEAFRRARRRHAEGELDSVVGTALTRVTDGEVRVRGRDLPAMVRGGASFEEVVDWLWAAEPHPGSWDGPSEEVRAAVARTTVTLPPGTRPLDRLRVAGAVASASDPWRFDLSREGVRRTARALLGALVVALPGEGRPADRPHQGLAARLWPRLTARRPLDPRRACLDAALGLLVDHGMASSTLAARVAASVRADPYSAVAAGFGVLGGRLHGAASGDVHRLFVGARRRRDPVAAVAEARERLGAFPGFGHPIHATADPRCTALLALLEEAWATDPRLATLTGVCEVVGGRTDSAPNVDFALGALTWLADMSPDAGEAIFAIARTAGLVAHALEELEEPPLRFRPRARYTGPR